MATTGSATIDYRRQLPGAGGGDSRLLQTLVLTIIVYVPLYTHFLTDFGVRGLNVFNVMLVGILLLMLSKRDRTLPRPVLGRRMFVLFGLYFYGLMLAWAGGSQHAVADLTMFKELVSYGMLFFVGYLVPRSLVDIRLYFVFICGATTLVAIELTREALDVSLLTTKRMSGPFQNPNSAGAFLVIFLPLMLAVALWGWPWRRRLARLAAIGGYLLGVYGVFATQSRQAFLGLAVVSVALASLRHVLYAVAVVFCIANFALWAPENVMNRIDKTFKDPEHGELDNSSEQRLAIWSGILRMSNDRPLGVGLNQLQTELLPYKPSWVTASDAHNSYLRMLGEMGWLGAAVFTLVLMSLPVLGLRIWHGPGGEEAKVFGAAFASAGIGFMAMNVFSSNFFQGLVTGNFWLLAGLMSRYRQMQLAGLVADSQAAEPAPKWRWVAPLAESTPLETSAGGGLAAGNVAAASSADAPEPVTDAWPRRQRQAGSNLFADLGVVPGQLLLLGLVFGILILSAKFL